MREFKFKDQIYIATQNGPHTKVHNKAELVSLPTKSFVVTLRVLVSASNEHEAMNVACNHYVGDLIGAEIA